MAKEDGGSAFPSEPKRLQMSPDGKTLVPFGFSGMTLRDWFAGQALVGLWANSDGIAVAGQNGSPGPQTAKWAYQLADAMLAERSR